MYAYFSVFTRCVFLGFTFRAKTISTYFCYTLLAFRFYSVKLLILVG